MAKTIVGRRAETRVLPDGGELTYNPFDIVEVGDGDRGIPRVVLYRHAGGERQPGFEVKLEVWDGVPTCTEVKVVAKHDDWVSVRPKDISLVADVLEKSIRHWLSELSYTPTYGADGGRNGWARGWGNPARRKEAMATIEKARKQVRRKPTRSHVEQVAKIYNTGSGLTKTERTNAVAAAFFFDPRTAQRKVKLARDAGLIKD
jgi:hypothetical protein